MKLLLSLLLLALAALALANQEQSEFSHPSTPVEFSPEHVASQEALSELARLRSTVARMPRAPVTRLIRAITREWAERHATQLTGERSEQFTRRSDSLSEPNGILAAVDYVTSTLTGYGFMCTTHKYRADYGPNVVCEKTGTKRADELVIMGAHLDDIPVQGRAPGANDDGSGSTSLLCMAQAIFQGKATFERTVLLEWYTGEEQGLVGSRALAKARRAQGQRVVAMIQQDMVGLHQRGDPSAVGFVQDPRSVDKDFTTFVEQTSRAYANNGFQVIPNTLSGSNCCSDSMSYHEQGYLAANYIEIRGYTGDPQYHKIGDVVDRDDYDLQQVADTAQVALASLAEIAMINV